MIAQLSKKVTSFFVLKKIVKMEDKEIYQYSFEILISTIINFIIIVVLSLVTQSVFESVFYFLGFIHLRLIAGGYHAKNHFRCFGILIFTYGLFISLIKLLPINYYLIVMVFATLISISLIFVLSPVEDANKPLSKIEKDNFKKKSRVAIIVFEIISFALFFSISYKFISLSIALGNFAVSISLLASIIRNKIINTGLNALRALTPVLMPEGH